MSSSLSQFLSYAVETCPRQINLVTFRSASHPAFFPSANSCKWPRVALSKTVQSWTSVHSVLPLPRLHSLPRPPPLPPWVDSLLTIGWAVHSSERPHPLGLVSSACDSNTRRPWGHLSSRNCPWSQRSSQLSQRGGWARGGRKETWLTTANCASSKAN